MRVLSQNNDVEFELSNENLEPLVIKEPQNWETDDKSYERDNEGGGTLKKVNTSLIIDGEGRNYIESIPLTFGYGSTLSITKRGKDQTKIGEDWRLFYHANLDLMAARYTDKTVEIPFKQGGLYDRIMARYSDEYDLVSQISADNKPISELKTVTEDVRGIEIFRKSELDISDGTKETLTFQGGDRDVAVGIPFQVVTNSDSDFINGITIGANQVPYNDEDYAGGLTGYMLYDRADIYKKLTLNGKIRLRMLDTEDGLMKLELIRYTYLNGDYTYVDGSRTELASIDTGVNLNELVYEFDDYVVEVQPDESIAIVAHTRIDSYVFGPKKVEWDYLDTYLQITLDDLYLPTQSKALLPFEMFDRLVEKITGEKGLFISKTFGRPELGYSELGEWATLAITSGYWGRGFDLGEPITDSNGEKIPPKQFNISLKRAFEDFYCQQPLFWGIEEKYGKEFLRIENYDYTQQDFIGIRLGRTIKGNFQYIPASNYEKTYLTETFYTGIEIGYEKGGGNYEEVVGLTSPHGTAKYNTSLNESESNVYAKISATRADLEAFEMQRRKPSTETPDEDVNYDKDLFFRHLIQQGNTWRLRKWQDDFESAPIGVGGEIYNPNSMGNLMLTPFRMLLRHKRIIGTGLHPEPFKPLTFISSNCYSTFSTKISGQDTITENGFILNKDLGDPYITGALLSFEGKVYQEMIDQIEGKTIIDGEEIPNWYGIFEAKRTDGTLVRGRLISSSINGNGKHEIAEI